MGDNKSIENGPNYDEDEDKENFPLSQLPVVGKVVNTAKNAYGTVKHSNPAVTAVLNLAEGTVKKVGGPVISTVVGSLAANAIPGAGAVVAAVMTEKQIQPVVEAVCSLAQTGIRKLLRRRR